MKKNRKIILIIIIALCILSLLFPISIKLSDKIGTTRYTMGELKENDIVEAHFKPNVNKMSNFGVRFATYNKLNKHGSIKLSLKEGENIIKEEVIDLKDIYDNEVYFLNFDEQINSNKKEYTLIMSFEKYYDDVSITLWCDQFMNDNNYILLNNDSVNLSLYYELTGYKKTRNIFSYFIMLLLGFIMINCSMVGEQNDKKIKK